MRSALVAAALHVPSLPAGLWAVLAALILAVGALVAVRRARMARNGVTHDYRQATRGETAALPGSIHDIVNLAGRAVSSDFASALFLRRVAEVASLAVASHAGVSLAEGRSLVVAGKWQADPRIRERLRLGRWQNRFESLREVEIFVGLFEQAIAGYRNE